MEDIKVTVGADIKPLEDALNAAGGSTDKFAAKATKNLSAAAAKIKASSTTAAFALQNLGRVAQDAPFGFIGIANNINPLLESFQRLRAETGSTGIALKALGSSLIGAGGLGLAVSLITSALTFFAMANRGSSKEVEHHKKVTDEATEKQREFNSAIDKAAGSIINEADKLKDLRDIIISTSSEITDLTDATIKQGLARFLFSEKNVAVQKLLSDEIKRQVDLTKKATPFFNVKEFNAQTADVLKKDALSKTFLQAVGAADKFASTIDADKDKIQELNNLSKGFEDIFAKLFDTEHRGRDKKVKDIETIADVLKKVAHQIEVINKEEIFQGANLAKEKISALEGAVKALFDRFNLGNEDARIIDLNVQINDIKLNEKLRTVVAAVQVEALANPIAIPLVVTPLSKEKLAEEIAKAVKNALGIIADKVEDELEKKIQGIIRNIGQSITQTLNSSIASIGAGIGDAIGKGGNLGKAIFGNLFEVLASGIKQIGESLIALGTAKIALDKFKFAPGIATVLAGLATVAIGSLLQSAIPKGFATGGFVSGPGTSKSDSIPARLSNGEYVMSASTVAKFGKGYFDMLNNNGRPRGNNFANGGMVSGNIGGGQAIQIFGEFELQGTKLVAVVQRAEARIRRNG